ncbi:MAG: metallophosphoesterase family protein [Bacteroidales bacterium]|nr:metallophosphoesterase family protein [Bacteroidales bacterium]
MVRVGVMSDSHGYVPVQAYSFFENVDVILHAGDIGGENVLEELRDMGKKVIAVYGNCDDRYIDSEVKGLLSFKIEDVSILMTHIGGYPKHYNPDIKPYFKQEKPDIFICGHSHILKVMYDDEYNFLLINPGACGHQGFHQVATLVRFEIDGKDIRNMQVLDFDKFK